LAFRLAEIPYFLEKRFEYQGQKNVEIELKISENNKVFIKGSSIEFSRVLSNLFNNAVESFLPKDGKVGCGPRGAERNLPS